VTASVDASLEYSISQTISVQREVTESYTVDKGAHIGFWQLFLTWQEDGVVQRLGLPRYKQTKGIDLSPNEPATNPDCRQAYYYECAVGEESMSEASGSGSISGNAGTLALLVHAFICLGRF